MPLLLKEFFYDLCKKYPDVTIGLTKEADIFWHYHILNTQKYLKDSTEIFGEFMHHDPDMIEDNMPIHKEAVSNYLNLYKQEFDLDKNEVMAHSARVLELKLPMAHSARAVGREEVEMAHSARAIGREEVEMAHSARAIGREEVEMAHSAREVGKENVEVATNNDYQKVAA